MVLNDTAIKALKPAKKRYEENDREGLFLEVFPSGRKVWRYRYRSGGKRPKLTIGPYPAIGLKEARKRRLEAEEMLHQGKDPVLDKRRKKEGGSSHRRRDSHDERLGRQLGNECAEAGDEESSAG